MASNEDEAQKLKPGLLRRLFSHDEPPAPPVAGPPSADAAALSELLQKKHGQTPEVALRYWCLTLFNLNEFVYLD